MFEAEKEYEALLVDDTLPWKLALDQKKKGQELKYWTALSKRGMQILKVQCVFDHPPLIAMKAYLDGATRLRYDANIKLCKLTEVIGCNLFRSIQESSKIAVVASRDLHIHYWVTMSPDGSVKMVVHEIDVPQIKGKVRMRCPVGGITIRPDPNDPNKSYAEHILEADLQGNIPQWVWTIVLKQGAYGLLKLRKLVP